jgi:hypothetical protein
MAKKQTFGKETSEQKGSQRRMAKVIVAKKTNRDNYAYKEAIIDEDEVQNFIKENKDN